MRTRSTRPLRAAPAAAGPRRHDAGRSRAAVFHGIATLEEPLDASQQVGLVDAHEADRVARGARPARAADAVDVVLGVPRELEVHDVRQVHDVEPARGDVGRDQDADLARLERLEGLGPVRLRAVRVDRGRGDAVAVQPGREPGRRELGPREHEDLVPVALDDEVGEQLLLAVPVHRVDQLADALRGRAVAGDLDRHRAPQDRPREPLDVVGERGREQQRLAAAGEQVEDPPDVGHEAHVEHPVRLVEDEDLDLAEVGRRAGRRGRAGGRAWRRGSRRRRAAP